MHRPAVLLLFAGLACSDPGPVAVGDMVPFARLVASATRVPDGSFWPRETEDAIATVRDDFPETGWKVPVGAPAHVEIDLAPWLGRTVALDRVEVAFTGGTPAVSAELSDGCGSRPTATLAWPDPAAPLALDGRNAGCVRLTVTSPQPVAMTALRLFNAGPIEWPAVALGSVPVAAAKHPGSGVIEGFYGRPWSWRERQKTMMALAVHGMDFYLYAPKDDPLHRHDWRKPYPAEAMDAFRGLTSFGAALGVRFVFGISPFIDFDFDDPADFEALRAKVLAFAGAGVTGFAVLADDIEMEADVQADGALAAKHVGVTNRLLAAVRAVDPEAAFWFCPTLYSDDRVADWPKGAEYLAGVAALDPSIRVLWTGTDTSSATLAGPDMDGFRAAVGRKPTIWDNFWANDGGDQFLGRILGAAYSGRAPDLAAATDGIAQNPSIQGSLSRVTLGTFGRWAEDPATAARDAQVARALEVEEAYCAGATRSAARDADTIRLILEVFDGHAKQDPAYAAMDAATGAFLDALGAGATVPATEAATLARIFARLAAVHSEVRHSGLDPDLVDDVWFPLDKARLHGLAGLWLLAAAGERLAGRDGAAAIAKADEADALARANRFYLSPLGPALRPPVEALTAADRGFVAPAAGDPDPAGCRAGAALSWNPFGPGTIVSVYGLPGAAVDGAAVNWTPPHAGRFEAVAVGAGAAGWAFRIAVIACGS